MKPLLVGECNPYGSDPRYALYPLPEGSAGWRLCKLVVGLNRGAYLRAFDRINLCTGKWSAREARDRAYSIKVERSPRDLEGDAPAIVLLGAKVCGAFAVDFAPFTACERFVNAGLVVARYVVLPHPSGKCRLWNDPNSFERARAALQEAGLPPEKEDER